MSYVLDIKDLRAGYGSFEVVHGIDLKLKEGEVVGLFGHNGAGKTTSLQTVFGLHKPNSGEIRLKGQVVTGRPCAEMVRRGMSLVMAENSVFADLSVLDNLRLGAYLEHSSDVIEQRLEGVYRLFPILEERGGQESRTLSGGQQRALSLGIALMAAPVVLLLDEPSIGLSPSLVQDMLGTVRELASQHGMSVLLVEQNVSQTVKIVDRAYFMRAGSILLEETATTLRNRKDFWDLF